MKSSSRTNRSRWNTRSSSTSNPYTLACADLFVMAKKQALANPSLDKESQHLQKKLAHQVTWLYIARQCWYLAQDATNIFNLANPIQSNPIVSSKALKFFLPLLH